MAPGFEKTRPAGARLPGTVRFVAPIGSEV
jgi:hypothetical protein